MILMYFVMYMCLVQYYFAEHWCITHSCESDLPLLYSSWLISLSVLWLTGLDEGEQENQDPASLQGAFLAFLHLRHLRIRDLQRTVGVARLDLSHCVILIMYIAQLGLPHCVILHL